MCGHRAVPEFDPWTGQPRGLIYDQYGDACLTLPAPWENPTRVVDPVPDDMLGRQAIPMPVGFALGIVLSMGVAAVTSLRRRVEPPGRS